MSCSAKREPQGSETLQDVQQPDAEPLVTGAGAGTGAAAIATATATTRTTTTATAAATAAAALREAQVAAVAMRGKLGHEVQEFRAEWDAEGVYVYQAFKDEIADWAVEHQKLGGPDFKPSRMTWIKPSFGWVLYRSGYGRKHNQNRVLKIKLPHDALGKLLSQCQCKEGGGGAKGRVQWDPERDLMSADGKVPRKMRRLRAIQIGLSGSLSDDYASSVLEVQDVTPLAHKVHRAHQIKSAVKRQAALLAIVPELPFEQPYMPYCRRTTLVDLGLLRGKTARSVALLGLGKNWEQP